MTLYVVFMDDGWVTFNKVLPAVWPGLPAGLELYYLDSAAQLLDYKGASAQLALIGTVTIVIVNLIGCFVLLGDGWCVCWCLMYCCGVFLFCGGLNPELPM